MQSPPELGDLGGDRKSWTEEIHTMIIEVKSII